MTTKIVVVDITVSGVGYCIVGWSTTKNTAVGFKKCNRFHKSKARPLIRLPPLQLLTYYVNFFYLINMVDTGSLREAL